VEENVGFMVGANGMENTGYWGITMVDTKTTGSL